MVAAALRESKDSPPPSPEKTFEQMQAEYDALPDLEEYSPEMEKVELRASTARAASSSSGSRTTARTRYGDTATTSGSMALALGSSCAG